MLFSLCTTALLVLQGGGVVPSREPCLRSQHLYKGPLLTSLASCHASPSPALPQSPPLPVPISWHGPGSCPSGGALSPDCLTSCHPLLKYMAPSRRGFSFAIVKLLGRKPLSPSLSVAFLAVPLHGPSPFPGHWVTHSPCSLKQRLRPLCLLCVHSTWTRQPPAGSQKRLSTERIGAESNIAKHLNATERQRSTKAKAGAGAIGGYGVAGDHQEVV